MRVNHCSIEKHELKDIWKWLKMPKIALKKLKFSSGHTDFDYPVFRPQKMNCGKKRLEREDMKTSPPDRGTVVDSKDFKSKENHVSFNMHELKFLENGKVSCELDKKKVSNIVFSKELLKFRKYFLEFSKMKIRQLFTEKLAILILVNLRKSPYFFFHFLPFCQNIKKDLKRNKVSFVYFDVIFWNFEGLE